MKIKNTIAFLLSLALAPIATLAAKPLGDQAARLPNIVLILSDDQSYTDYSFMGHEHIETPHLDQLASESALFKRGYVPTALCRPALMTIATGLYSHQNKTTGNAPDNTPENAAHAKKAGKTAKELLISHVDKTGTIAKWLGEKGYVSHQSGKWWEGSYQRGGFTEGMTRGYPDKGGRHGDDGLKIGRQGMEPMFDFIDRSVADEKPFFVWYAPFLPHTPHDPPKELADKYVAKGVHQRVAKYYANIERLDDTVGLLMEKLDDAGVTEDTLVIYVTDNGWIQTEAPGYAPRSKRSPNEGGTRNPIMFRWPGTIPAADRPELCSSIDIVPTILAAAGAEAPHDFPGLDLLPQLKSGDAIDRDTLYGESFAHDIADIENPNASLLYRWVIRDDHKLLLTYDGAPGRMKYPPAGGEAQLYNLKTDPGENDNLASKKPELVKELRGLVNQWYPVGERKEGAVGNAEPAKQKAPRKTQAGKQRPKGNAAATAGEATGFRSLFNGRNLDGWAGNPELWSVVDGCITGVTTGPRQLANNQFLIWKGGEVENFELRARIRQSGNNTGIQYRSEERQDRGEWAVGGYQCDVHPRAANNAMVYEEGGRGIVARNGQSVVVDPDGSKWLVEEREPVKVDVAEWNEYTIIARGNHLVHKLNGEVTINLVDHEKEAMSLSGLLAFQIHRGPAMKVEIKDVQLRELPAGGVIPYAKSDIPNDAKFIEKPAPKKPKNRAKGKGKAKESASRTVTNEDGITSISGFEVERLYTVPAEMGSWVAMGVGPDGTLYACDQKDAGVFTVKVGEAGSVEVEPLALDFPEGEKPLISARGVSHSFGALWFHLQPKGFLKLWDSDGDGDFDKKELITQLTGNGEHGNHAIIPTADGNGLYIDGGNSATLPEFARSRVTSWDEDLLLSRMWDARGHARGRLAPAGWVTKFDPNKKTQEVYSIGYRNQYDIALNRNGDLFTYDADMEWDMGSPWYRPTRICHVVSGSDYGWRSGSGKWPTYYEDSLPPVVEVGPGSPTGMIQGSEAKFPAKYRDALFAFDWTFGTIYAVHLTPEGAGYTGELEPFVYGAPLPVTDGVIGNDGAMYFATGGRGLESHLYRVRYTGPEPAVVGKGNDTPETIKARELRRSLEVFHGVEDKTAVAKAWPHLSSADRFLRHAARVAVESQPVESWAESVLKEQNAQARITAAVALARSGTETHRAKLIASLLELDPKQLSESEFLGLLRAYALTFIRLGEPNAEEREAVIAELDPFLPNQSDDLNTELIRVLVYLRSPTVIEKGLALIAARGKPEIPDWTELASRNERYGTTVQKMLDNYPPVQEMGYAFMLRNIKQGWTMKQRRAFFGFLNVAAKGSGGASFPGYMENIRAEALANLSDEEREALADITGENFNPMPDFEIAVPKGPGQVYTLESAMKAVSGPGKADFEHGRSMFFATSCGACHRFKGLGGSIGPDLTSLPNKFDEAYLLEAIIDPGKDISDQYGSSLVTMNDGTVHAGLVIEKGDVVDVYSHDPKADPLTLSHSDIAEIKQSPVSQMPPGLINMLSPKEVKDLVTYLMSGGDPKNKRYGRPKKKKKE